MAKQKLTRPSYEYVFKRFVYDPDTGMLSRRFRFWREATGKEASRRFGGKDHYSVMVRGRAYMTHRVIWLLMTGFWPEDIVIYHVNGNRLDNRWDNLREATPEDRKQMREQARRAREHWRSLDTPSNNDHD